MIIIAVTNALAQSLMKSARNLWAISREQKIAAKSPIKTSSGLLSLFGFAKKAVVDDYHRRLRRQERAALYQVKRNARTLINSLPINNVPKPTAAERFALSIRANLHTACCPA